MQIIKSNLKLITYLIIMALISIITLYNADIINTSINGIVYKQILWYIIGLVVIISIVLIKNKTIYSLIKYFYIFLNLILLGLLLFSDPINNAKCWIEIPSIGTIQPSEFMKITLIIYTSIYISKYKKKHKILNMKDELKLFIKIILLLLIPGILTFLEPDTGAVIMYFIAVITILYISGISYKWLILVISIIIPIVLIILYLYFFNTNIFIKLLGNSFFLRVERLINWANTSGMQLENGITAIGSGGITGKLLINDIYFPEAHTDFIFAVYAYNFGYIGSIFLILIITLFDIEIIKIAKKCKRKVDKYIISGFIGVLFYQQVQNIGMTFGLLPITGITLPFISYGGSSLISYMIMIGIIININTENFKYHN